MVLEVRSSLGYAGGGGGDDSLFTTQVFTWMIVEDSAAFWVSTATWVDQTFRCAGEE